MKVGLHLKLFLGVMKSLLIVSMMSVKNTATYLLWLGFISLIVAVIYQYTDTSSFEEEKAPNRLISHKINKPKSHSTPINPADLSNTNIDLENKTIEPAVHFNSAPATDNDPYELIRSEVSGVVFFDRLSFVESTENDLTYYQFDPYAPQINPVRFIQVNLRNGNDGLVAKTYTDELGQYTFNVKVYGYRPDYYIEVVAMMKIDDHQQTSTSVSVVNQGALYQELTNKNRIYHVKSSPFQLYEGENNHDIHLTTGWHPTLDEFENHLIQAQPFAILDSLAKGFLYLKDHEISFPKDPNHLTIHWSQDPDIIEASTGYYRSSQNLIYISGKNAQDTDLKPITTISEWNEHTILHEFGHYYLAKIVGRDDTQGGRHGFFGFGSLTLALSEGLANALAKTILKDWQYKRVSFDVNKKRFATNPNAIINNETENLKRTLVNQGGQQYQRPYFDFSPFIENTIEYFILSIIDPRSEYSLRTTKLHDEIGFLGLHQALLTSAQSASLLTIYSLAESLKLNNQNYNHDINELGYQLDLNFIDQWGNGQQVIESHIIGRHNELLPEPTQYPFYQTVNIGNLNEISFNGGLQSLAPMRPGTLRYLKLTAPIDSTIEIVIANAKDDDDNLHKFSFNIINSGKIIDRSREYKDGSFSYSVLNVIRGETYIIRLFDELFKDPKIKSEQTVTTKVEISHR